MPDLRPTLIRPNWGVRFGRYARLSAVVLGVGLIALQLYPATGLAECDPDDDACLQQEGDNDADVDIDAEGQGGDAIAGSQVISVAGGGDTQIEANNRSRFARAKGGDVEGKIETTIDNGPRLEVEQGSSDTSVVSSGVAQIDQTARPRVGITLDQFSAPTGTAGLSNTAFATTFATGTNVVSQAPLGVGSVTQVVDQAAETPVMSSVMPEIGISSDNVSFVTGVAPVTQSATARVTPAALAFGAGSTSAVVTATVPVTQDASPAVALSVDQVASPTGLGLVSTSARSIVRLDALNDARGALGVVDQTITQSGSSSVTNTVTPVIDVTATNTATIIGASPVNQQATGAASPSATAIGGFGEGVSAALFQIGDNVESVDVQFALVGGDAIAGSNVIAVAGAGDTTVDATNDSMFASAEGGDTASIANTSIDNGPRLTLGGGGGGGSLANALGFGTQAQTAGTSFAGPRADPDAAPRLGSVLTTVLTRTGVPTTP